MRNKNVPKKLLSCFFVFATIIIVSIFMAVTSSAASYESIVLDVPRISQRPNTGDCAIASIATVEAYKYGYSSGDYNSSVYQSVYAANGYTISAYWGKLGYEKRSFDLETIYSQLASGNPVIVHRTSSHYSVIYGYTGDSSSLSKSGFLVEDVDDSYNDSNAKKNLSQWQGGASLDQIVIRKDGVSIPQNEITITCNHPEENHTQGETFSVAGNVVSKHDISSVHAYILDSDGYYAADSTYTYFPYTKSFKLSTGDQYLHFSKLPTGFFLYKIVATDTSGATATYSYNFYVTNGTSGTWRPSFNTFLVRTTAEPYLNLRSGADTSYSVLGKIYSGTVLRVVDKIGSWGKVNYGGGTGWISLDYCIEKLGDLNDDGKVNSEDALSVVMYTVGKKYLNSVQLNRGDLNADGLVNSTDALKILNFAVGK